VFLISNANATRQSHPISSVDPSSDTEMRSFLTIVLASGALIASVGAVQKRLGGLLPHVRRQFMSCEETYGENWILCGDEVCPTSVAQSRYPDRGADRWISKRPADSASAQPLARSVVETPRSAC
jgi:hypothetical protein